MINLLRRLIHRTVTRKFYLKQYWIFPFQVFVLMRLLVVEQIFKDGGMIFIFFSAIQLQSCISRMVKQLGRLS